MAISKDVNTLLSSASNTQQSYNEGDILVLDEIILDAIKTATQSNNSNLIGIDNVEHLNFCRNQFDEATKNRTLREDYSSLRGDIIGALQNIRMKLHTGV